MLGDSLNEKRYESILHFNKAYFIKMSNCKASLVIPMQAKVDTITINSELNIITAEDDDIYFLAYNRTLEDVEYEYEGTIYTPSWLGYNNVIYYIYNIAEML